MRRIASVLVFASVCVACNGAESSEATQDGATDGLADAATHDSLGAPDDSAFHVDTGTDAATCPPTLPTNGSACSGALFCPYPDSVCGGETSASCVDHVWQVPTPTCGSWCPASRPADGTTCTNAAEDVCWYWDAIADPSTSCSSCSCVGGAWSCKDPLSCPFPPTDCAPKKACSDPHVGCGTGKCSFFCRCGADSTFQCLANPC